MASSWNVLFAVLSIIAGLMVMVVSIYNLATTGAYFKSIIINLYILYVYPLFLTLLLYECSLLILYICKIFWYSYSCSGNLLAIMVG